MNIFKVLSTADGKIHEPSVTAFLAFLLDPGGAHGLGSSFLEEFLIRFVRIPRSELKDLCDGSGDSCEVADLAVRQEKSKRSSSYDVTVEAEFTVQTKGKENKDIDILVFFSQGSDLKHVLCIENKISAKAIKKDQLIKETEGIINKYVETGKKGAKLPTFSMIFLTPDQGPKAQKAFDEFAMQLEESDLQNRVKIMTDHFIWSHTTDESVASIYACLETLIEKDSRGDIDPIQDQSMYLMKSFLSFINCGFRSYKQEKKRGKSSSNFEFNGHVYKGLRATVLAVFKHHVKETYPDYATLKTDFSDEILPSNNRVKGIVCTEEEAKTITHKTQRYFLRDNELLCTQDGVKVAVNNQWTRSSMQAFIARAYEKFGYEINEVEDNS